MKPTPEEIRAEIYDRYCAAINERMARVDWSKTPAPGGALKIVNSKVMHEAMNAINLLIGLPSDFKWDYAPETVLLKRSAA
jgi:hypothetical protein